MDYLYGTGAEQTYALGTVISFVLRNGDEEVNAQGVIKKAFTPFSQSQVFLVDVSGTPTSDGVAILKIYDPRFLRVRKGNGLGRPDMPWSLELEIAAVERRAALPQPDDDAASHSSSDPPSDRDSEPHSDGDSDPPSERDLDGHSSRKSESNSPRAAIDPVDFEIKLLDVCDDLFDNESTCYSRLAPLQGKGVPLCYGTGVVHAVSPDPSTPRPISPKCILLEYVDGDNLMTVDRQRITRAVARSLLETVHAFAGLGVIHADLHRGNVIFSPRTGEKATRAVVIDFAQGGYRVEDQSDESWQDDVDANWDFAGMCGELNKLGIREEDPIPCTLDYGPEGAMTWNIWASKHPRWVEPCDEIWVGQEGVQLVEPIRWRLRPEVQDWVDDPNKQGAVPPRPGSPLDE